MTGFGQAADENGRYRVSVTLRGVNHRQLDIVLRLRESYRCSEPQVRELLVSELSRGRVEATLDVEPLLPRQVTVHVRSEVVQAIQRSFEELAASGVPAGQLQAKDLLQLPQVLEIVQSETTWEEEDHRLLLAVSRSALDQFMAARDREGEHLRGFLGTQVEESAAVVDQLRCRRQLVRGEIEQSLRQRLHELIASENLDEMRLAQEVTLLVERSDVSEELDRVTAHLEHFKSVLTQSGPVGRRLDFLTQEIFREWSTLGAKCRDPQMSRWALDGKVLCEQLREQVQNVE